MFFLSLSDQSQVAIILAVLFGLLVWGRWRYDGIVLITLAFMVMMDLVPAKEAFMGFGHPAVITVALVLLISKGLEKSGFISMIGNFLHKRVTSQAQFMVLILVTAAFLSSFMNNIGAMAMLLPITIGIAQKKEWNPSKFLMPLAFASILGGMNTKIEYSALIPLLKQWYQRRVLKTYSFRVTWSTRNNSRSSYRIRCN